MENKPRTRRPVLSRIEPLEARIAPAALVSVSAGNLSVVDGSDLDDAITISVNGANYRFSDPGGITAGTGATTLSANDVEVPIASVTGSFTVLTNGGGDNVLFSGAVSTPGDLTVDTGTGNDLISISGALTPGGHTVLTSAGAVLINDEVTLVADKNLQVDAGDTIGFFMPTSSAATTGTGIISLTTTREIILAPGSSLTSTDGAITLSANTAATGIGFFVGIIVDGATISASSVGAVSLTGRGGDSGGNQHGISLLNGALVSGGFGGTTLVGNGGTIVGGNGSIGVLVDDGTITSSGGNVSVTGTGGDGADSGESSGVYLATASALITSTGIGTVTVIGTGGDAATSTNTGVDVRFGAQLTSGGGNVSVTGTGGPNPGGVNPGVRSIIGSSIAASGLGSLTVVGTGGPGIDSHGVTVEGVGSFFAASGGSISITGGSLSATGFGVSINNGAIASGGSPIFIEADSIDIQSSQGPGIDSGIAPTTLTTRSPGVAIDLGGADVIFGGPPTLGISDTELDLIFANPLQIGGIANGTLTVTAPITPAGSLVLASGMDIVFNNNIVTMPASASLSAVATRTITLSGPSANLSASALGFISLDAGRNIELFGGASITTVDANITLFANTDATGVGGFVGIALDDVGLITTGAGGITLVATGGDGGSGSVGNRGISLTNAFISTTLPAPLLGESIINITGTGGTGSSGNDGVFIDGGAVTSTSDLNITGFLPGVAGGVGINLQNGADLITVDPTTVLSLTGDTMILTGASIDAALGTGTVSINTADPLRPIDLGAAANGPDLNLTDADLDNISAGIIAIGTPALTSGPITISAPITRTTPIGIQLFTGDNAIDFRGGSINTGGGLLEILTGFAGTVTADASGVDVIGGNLAISAGNVGSNGIGTVTNPLRVNVAILATTTSSSDAGQFFSGTAGIGQATPDLTGLDAGLGTIRFVSGTFTTLLDEVIADISPVVVASGATFSIGANTETIGDITGNGTLDLGTGSFTTGSNSNTTLDALIIGTSGSFNKISGGTLTLTNTANSFGPTDINIDAGVLRVTSDAPLGDPGNTIRLSEGTLRVPVGFTTSRPFVVAEGSTGTIDIGSGTMKLIGLIDASGVLAKTGDGTLKFGDDFTGTTRVDDGILTTSGSVLAVDGDGSVLVVVVDDGAGGTRIDEIRLINTTADTVINIAGPSNPNKTSTVTKIISEDATVEIGTITLAANIILGDGIADNIPDVDIEGRVGNLIFGDVAANTLFTLGKGLPYDVSGDTTTPDSYNNRPNVTLKTILGPGVIIDVTGDGTPSGVGGGGLGVLKVDSWAFPGTVQTTQSIATFKVKTGNTFVTLLLDHLGNGAATVADMGKIKIVEGSWGGTGSEIEGSVGSFDAKSFLTGASLSAASIAKFTTKKGKFAGTITLTDANTAVLSTFTVASSFTGTIDAAGPITTVLVKGVFKGSLKAKAIGSITAASFDGTTDNDQGIYGDANRHNIWATGGSIGTLKTTAGGIQQFEIISSTTFGGFGIKQSGALVDTVGLDGVFVSAASIGKTSVSLASPVGASLIGIRDSVFSSAGSIGNITSSHSVMGTIVAAGTTLGAVNIGVNLTSSQLLAGVHLGANGVLGGGDDIFTRAASIADITVKGKLGTTSIAAGIAPGTNGLFGDGDDIAASGTSLAGKAIGKITLGAASGSLIAGTGATPSYAIEAASFSSIVIGGKTTATIPTGSVIHAPGSDAAADIALLVI